MCEQDCETKMLFFISPKPIGHFRQHVLYVSPSQVTLVKLRARIDLICQGLKKQISRLPWEGYCSQQSSLYILMTSEITAADPKRQSCRTL